MSDKAVQLSTRLLGKPWEMASELERRVLHAVAERLPVSRHIHGEVEEAFTLGQRLADRVAAFGGSWPFIIIFFIILAAWMVLNSVMLGARAFDPYPYILLNLVLSCLASIQAPLILMSQNRQAHKDRAQALHDYEVNLKAEFEIMQLHDKLEMLRAQELGRMLELLQTQIHMIEKLQSREAGG